VKNQKLSYIYALCSVLLWSTVATAFKLSLRYLTAEELLFYSSLVSLVLLFFMLVLQGKVSLMLEYLSKNFATILLLGLINPFLYYLILFKAYELLPAQEAQAINYTWALVLSYLSVIFLKHKLSRIDIIAGIIAYLGVLIIATKGDLLSLHFSNFQGVVFAILSTVLWAFYWILNTRLKTDSVITLFCNFLVGFIAIAVYLYIKEGFKEVDIRGVVASVYVGFFEMGITFLLWLKALKYSQNTSKTANLIFLSPIISLVFIHFIVGEKIENSTIIALFLILSALLLQRVKTKR